MASLTKYWLNRWCTSLDLNRYWSTCRSGRPAWLHPSLGRILQTAGLLLPLSATWTTTTTWGTSPTTTATATGTPRGTARRTPRGTAGTTAVELSTVKVCIILTEGCGEICSAFGKETGWIRGVNKSLQVFILKLNFNK